MQFTPKTDADFQQEETERKNKFVWPANSVVDYEIKSATEKLSKKGKDMIEADVDVYNAAGEAQTIRVWLGEWNLWLVKHICEGNGLLAEYESGNVHDYDLIGKTGKAKLNIQKGAQKEDGTFYPDKNGIADFLLNDEQQVAKTERKTALAKASGDFDFEDTVPF